MGDIREFLKAFQDFVDDEQQEEWRHIKDFEEYEVSNLGSVRSIDRYVEFNGKKVFKKGKVIKPYYLKGGYAVVHLYKNNKVHCYLVHRLVAETFLPNPYNLPIINHKDENRLNNCVWNLEWCTIKYNNAYGNAPRKRKIGCEKPIVGVDKNGNKYYFKSIKEAAQLGFARRNNICDCLKGRIKTAGKMFWYYD